MPAQPRVVKVTGNLKNYPWGRKNGLTEFKVLASENPQAELWFGNHSAGPSFEVSTGEPLATVPAFPLLVKILAIGKPLSIQVHPNQDFAEQNFEKLKLSDKNGKDEILIALETVRAFAGIKSDNVRSQVAKSFQLNSFDKDFLSQCNEIFNLSKNQIEEKLTLLQNSFSDDTERKVFSDLVKTYPNDPGVLVASLLQFHELSPGEGLHVPPGCPHEYLSGLAIEVMTNSDNVFRMGLTNKPIDRDNSLKVLGDESFTRFPAGGTYKPRASFEVKLLHDTTYQVAKCDYQVLLCLTGTAVFDSQKQKYSLAPGEALLISGEITGDLVVTGRATVAIHGEDGRL